MAFAGPHLPSADLHQCACKPGDTPRFVLHEAGLINSMGDSDNRHAFGWAPVGARILREYSATAGTVDTAPTVRYAKTWTEIKALPVMQQLLSLAVQQMVLLHAVDTFPRGKMAGLRCQAVPLNPTISAGKSLVRRLQDKHQAQAVQLIFLTHGSLGCAPLAPLFNVTQPLPVPPLGPLTTSLLHGHQLQSTSPILPAHLGSLPPCPSSALSMSTCRLLPQTYHPVSALGMHCLSLVVEGAPALTPTPTLTPPHCLTSPTPPLPPSSGGLCQGICLDRQSYPHFHTSQPPSTPVTSFQHHRWPVSG